MLVVEKYETPDMKVVKVEAENFICQSNQVLLWLAAGTADTYNSPADDEWERSGYGNADEL